jgi:response regulator RpfG family c-di-GMP phosphodiesterase
MYRVRHLREYVSRDRNHGIRRGLIAGILTITESFDVMTGPLSEKVSMSFGDAVQELKCKTGSQFHPGLVETFV